MASQNPILKQFSRENLHLERRPWLPHPWKKSLPTTHLLWRNL